MTLTDFTFIDLGENLLISGATGCDKSYLVCALGRQICSLVSRNLSFGMHRFFERITLSMFEKRYGKSPPRILHNYCLLSVMNTSITRPSLMPLWTDCSIRPLF
jgi:DNA replication protein DnaC